MHQGEFCNLDFVKAWDLMRLGRPGELGRADETTAFKWQSAQHLMSLVAQCTFYRATCNAGQFKCHCSALFLVLQGLLFSTCVIEVAIFWGGGLPKHKAAWRTHLKSPETSLKNSLII